MVRLVQQKFGLVEMGPNYPRYYAQDNLHQMEMGQAFYRRTLIFINWNMHLDYFFYHSD